MSKDDTLKELRLIGALLERLGYNEKDSIRVLNQELQNQLGEPDEGVEV